ncbi:hypothetical protein EXM22_01385 [Oceanispirochaeta crateris]|uniref:Uncharacterized protein n=1 Tax=Oceanispirochaeta crateris TaxID=2518645 RepID=A0A5C1QGW2_9SPIO|nr:hypothetical protein [Oceanispirochaeta crateris]QEN06707.1 hypothetical protein EXM22_01385 [Oceanispirochaeta crateris]
MKKILWTLLVSLLLFGCTEYGGRQYVSSKRKNIQIFNERGTNPKFIKNNIWNLSHFLKDKIPGQSNEYEVFIVEDDFGNLLSDEIFSNHIFNRIEENSLYTEDERTGAKLLVHNDIQKIISNRNFRKTETFLLLPIANIILLKNNSGYDKDLFLYGYLTLLLLEHNPAYYLNPLQTEQDRTDRIILGYITTGLSSLYSRYFTKYPDRKQSKDLYLKLIKNDIQYIEDIYDIDVLKYKNTSSETLAFENSFIYFYSYFFEYLIDSLDEDEFQDLIDSLFIQDHNKRQRLRDLYNKWKANI